jgi:hypothetical protein
LEANKEGHPCLLSSGAPDSLVRHRTVTVDGPMPISFLFWRRRPLQLRGSWRTGHCPVHTVQSGAPCRPLARATRRPRIVRPTVALATVGSPDSLVPLSTVGMGHASPADCTTDRCASDRWLTGQSGAPPDSPVNYSHTLQNISRERPFHRSPVWRTGHGPVHHRIVRCARLS